MRKLLIMLMVVAMASFLFVGCFGTTPDIPDVDEDVAVTGVTLDKATLALTVGDAPVTLVATVAPATATETSVIWASSDKTVAIVAAGLVTPLNAGISAIMVTTVDGGFVATCVVTVTAEEEPTLPTSTTPVIEKIANVADGDDDPGIINLYSSETQYMNEAKIDDGILVKGFAPKYSDIQVYVDGEVVGTGISYGVYEGFIVFVAEDDLGDDGEKTIYATATEVGLDESDASIEYAFTLDTVAPKIVSVAVEAEDLNAGDEVTTTVTCSEAIDEDSLVLELVGFEGPVNVNIWGISAAPSFDNSHPRIYPDSIEYDLVAPEVFELIGEFSEVPVDTDEDDVIPTSIGVGTPFRVSYQISEAPTGGDDPDEDDYVPITDLAGNGLVESVHYCFLEVEE